MNTFTLEKWLEERLCTFYTVKMDGAAENETDKFFSKYYAQERLKTSVQELAAFLSVSIGSTFGAREQYFRFENDAQALPPNREIKANHLTLKFKGFPLRLYCLRISNELVILFGGGQKTSQTAQDGETRTSFLEANRFAKRILEALEEEMIMIVGDGRIITDFNGEKEVVL